jgi:class 3 adenylate cyclase
MPRTATNPQTGETVQFDEASGQWVSMQQPAAPQQEPSLGDQLQRQLGLTARAGIEGIAALPSMLAEIPRQALNLIPGVNFPPQQQNLSNLLTQAGLPSPETPVERIAGAGAQAMTGAGGVAGLAGKLAGAAPGIAATLAAQPAQQIAGGLGAGLAGQGTAEAGGGPLAQFAASLAGGLTGAGLTGLATRPPKPVAPAIAEAEKQGINVMTSDVKPPGNFASKWLQSTGERIPLAGTGGVRQAQQTQRIDAVKNVLRDFGADDAVQASDKVMLDLMKTRSGALNKYSSLKNEVIDRLDNAGIVPVNSAVNTIDDQISRLSALRTKEVEPVIARLNDFKDSIQGQGLKNVEELRKQLGESFKAPELSSVRSTGEKIVSKIYGSLREDMGDFIKSVGNRRDVDKWSLANKRLSNMAGEINKGTLKSILSRGDATPEVVRQMLFSKKPSEIKLLYKNLSPKGRANARIAILNEAATKSGGIENISPDRFSTQVKKMGDSIGVFFSGNELKKVEGLSRALDLTRRASEAALNPPTGVQVAIPVGAAVLADILGSGGAAVGAGATVGLAARLFESAPVRNILIKLPSVTRGSSEEAALFKRLLSAIQVADIQQKAE